MDPEQIILPEKVWQGIELINQQEYFAAHELLEIAWREEPAQIRRLYQGLLQAGVGYHHLLRKNYRGALKSFSHAHQNLEAWLNSTIIPLDLQDLSHQMNDTENWINQGANGRNRPLFIRSVRPTS